MAKLMQNAFLTQFLDPIGSDSFSAIPAYFQIMRRGGFL